MSGAVNQHRCAENVCPYFGQVSPRGCECHVSDQDFIRGQRDELLTALDAVLNEDSAPVHVGYDERGNYLWADAVRTDSDAFRLARAAIAKATGQ